MNPVKYGYKFDGGEILVPTVMTGAPIPVVFSVPCNYSKCSRLGTYNVGWDKLFFVTIENVKIMQNGKKIHELKAFITLTFVQEFLLINNPPTLYLQYQRSKWFNITMYKSPKTAPGVHVTLYSWKRITQWY